MPRIMVEWTIKNEDDHFSYEDIGSLSICLWLLLIQFSLGAFLVKAYIKNIKENERYLSPHFIMLTSIYAQIVSLCLETVHLWYYSTDGEGFMVLDILGKIAQAGSEV
jgi:hypothetical protein